MSPTRFGPFDACRPAFRNTVVRRRVAQLQAGTSAISIGRPRKVVIIIERVRQVALRVEENNFIRAVRKPPCPIANDSDIRVFCAQGSAVPGHDQILVCSEDRSGGKSQLSAPRDLPAGQIHRCHRAIVEFDPLLAVFGRIAVVVGTVRWRKVIHDLVNDDFIVQ